MADEIIEQPAIEYETDNDGLWQIIPGGRILVEPSASFFDSFRADKEKRQAEEQEQKIQREIDRLIRESYRDQAIANIEAKKVK